MKRVLISYACLTLAMSLGPLGRYAHAQTAPSTYSAYTGTDTKPIPPAPALGPANSVIVDPTFGSQILRVTDENTNGGQSFMPIDAGFFRAWNANSTAIKLTGPGGSGYWIEFDPNTFKVGDGSSRPVIHPVSFGSRWEWSTVDPDTIYFLNGNQIGAYNKSTGVIRNLGGPPTGEPVAYFPVVIGQDDWVCAAAGSGFQDTYTKMFCVNPVNTGTSKFIDVLNKTINGVPQPNPWPTSAAGQTIGIHSLSGGTGASWLEVTFHGQNWGANGGTVFNLSTNTWSFVTNADPYWSGHLAMGNGKYVNSSGSINGRDSRSMVIRNPDNLMNSANYLFIEKPPDTLNQWCDVDHSSWLNSMSNPNAPVLVSRYTVVQPCQFAWSGEIIAAAVDGSNTVWRFAHNHSTFNCYYGEGFAQISNDGKWALFSSYWDGRLGPDNSFGCGTRIDTFIVRLVSPSQPTAPTGLTAVATGGSQINLSWTASTDDVGVTGYQIERCQGTGCANFSGIAAPAGTGTTYTDAGLSSGTAYSYRVRATDSAGNLSGYSNTATATPASSPPSVAITSPTAGASFSAPANVAISANASDSDGTVSTVEFFQNGNLLGQDTNGADGWSFNWTGAPAGTYSVTARATDNSGMQTTSSAVNITVGDTTPPVISGPTVSSVTTSSAAISWTTNEPSDSQVDYGTTAAYGSSTTLNSSMVASHSQSLSGLTPNTTYHFHMKSKDAAGNLGTSADFTFTTAASGGSGFTAKVDFQPAGATYPGYLVESGSQFGNRGNGFTYGWNASGAGMETRVRNSSLSPDQRYDTLAVMGDAAWEIAVPNGTYVVHVVVGDADYTDVVSKLTVEGVMAINGSTSPSNRWLETTVTVSVSDGRLTITNLPGSYNKICYVDISGSSSSPPSVAITSPTAGASFSAPANVAISANASDSDGTVSTVEFFQNGNLLGQDTNGADGWSFNWTGAPAGTYSVTARATDNSGMQTTSSAVNITVGDTTPPVISGPTVSSVTTSSAAISWTTNEPSDSQVDYGTTAAYGSSTTLNSSMVASHSQSLSGLTPNTTYHFHMKSKDAAGNLGTSADFTFTTAASGGSGFTAKVDFQPAGATYPGYLVESGSQFGNRGNGFTYGWNASGAGMETRVRNSSLSPDQRYDTLAVMGDAAWEIAVPNGTYVVHVVVGDADYTDVVSKLTVEGVMAINGSTSPSNRWLETTVTVSVSDGRLTITNLPGSYNKICYVDISGSSSSPPSVAITSPTAGASFSAPANVAISANASDSDGTVSTVEFFQNGNLLGQDTNGADGWSFNWTGAPAGTYSVTARATDNSGMQTTSSAVNITVGDTTPPVISGPTVSSVTTSSVTIQWTTNEPSDSQVDYGTTAAYGSSTTLNSSMVASHSQSLSGLTPNTTYHFHMKSKDAAGNLGTSADFTFTTAASGGSGFTAKVDFQPAGPTYPGYLVEAGSQYGNRGNGFTYGWNASGAGMETRVRNSSLSPDQRYDTLAVMGDAAWEIAVPNGTYVVHVVVGDADYTDVVSKLTVEGVMAINGSTSSSNRWLETTVTVSVSDGRLTITNLPGSYNKICYVDISVP